MARLQSGDLSFDFRYAGFEYGWVRYEFYFKWKDESLARNDLLKRWGDYWGRRPEGAFLANEYEGDGLIPLLKRVLDDDKADYWEPMEPDIVIAIYPEEYFPFLPSHHKLLYERPEYKAKRGAREALKKEKGKQPDDSYTLIVFVDAYNFKEADAYYGQGLSLHMIVSRNELEEFAKSLEYEYQEFKQRLEVDQWLEQNA
jgi:hypothetical protein